MNKLLKHAGTAVAVAALLASCSSEGDDVASTNEPLPSSATSAPASGASSAPSESGLPIRITFGDTTFTARLNNTSTAQGLVERLPLTLPFRDLMSAEKISPLGQPLPTEGVPRGDDPVPGDIGYWVPDGNLVLYYGEVGYWDGIVRIGTFEGDRNALAQQNDGFQVTIERANG